MTASYAWENTKHMHVNWEVNASVYKKGIVSLALNCEIPLQFPALVLYS